MLYKSCSINEVIARLIRNTRIQDSSYIADFNEWIPEAMGFMRTKFVLKSVYQDVPIVFHKGKLPCDLEQLDAVEYNGRRLPVSNTVKNYRTGHNLSNGIDNNINDTELFTSIIQSTPNQTYYDENNLMFSSDIQPTTDNLNVEEDCEAQPTDWYGIESNYITTSFVDGTVRLHYMARPSDENGLPLIPDNEDYKQALYYYVRAMMIGAGFDDRAFKYEQCMQHFETHARRAINQISYPTPDQREQLLKTAVRFIPPQNYWENFFRTDNHENQLY
jgi:hypothetical protein